MAKVPDPDNNREQTFFKSDPIVSDFLCSQDIKIPLLVEGLEEYYSNYVRLYHTIRDFLNGRGEWDAEFYADQNPHAQKALRAAVMVKQAKSDA